MGELDVLQFGVAGASMIVMFYLAKAIYELVRKKAGLDGKPQMLTSSEWAVALDAHTKAMKDNVHEMDKVLREDRQERFRQQDKHVRALMDLHHKQELVFAKFDAMLETGVFGRRGKA